jgi:tRNA pseudouridine38-40 synthase
VNTVRRIEEIEISEKEGLLVFRVRGNAFLHNMIRIIIGTLLDMHREKRDAEYMREVLEKRDRTFSGITAPPCGLYLYRITYTPSLEEMESAF